MDLKVNSIATTDSSALGTFGATVESILNCQPDFSDYWHRMCWPTTTTQLHTSYTPSNYLVSHKDDHVRVDIVAPGLLKETIDITYNPNNRSLLLKGSKKKDAYVASCELVQCVLLHKDVDHTNATANYEDGILTIQLPYRAELRTTRINVK